ncbi:MAG: hypothetical protein Q8K89_12470, partial [Actinomycetota bacterium]|nr:hypothetical protein [Actinomycetota bacterium]
PATAAGMNAGQVAADASTADVRSPSMPTYLSGAVRSLHLDEERVGAALTADRRPQLLASRSPNLRAIVLGVAAVAGAALLWPLWRSVPVQGLAVVARRDDVAAVVSR